MPPSQTLCVPPRRAPGPAAPVVAAERVGQWRDETGEAPPARVCLLYHRRQASLPLSAGRTRGASPARRPLGARAARTRGSSSVPHAAAGWVAQAPSPMDKRPMGTHVVALATLTPPPPSLRWRCCLYKNIMI